ncbi:Bud-site selection protein [Westerdykella ornata]|uniref:Bud-site selection protein n=1 Tax=Westerdykella ornata TaxID=318751 RepID=A0A6A6J521_WESOR|nr:Bud-site selection protein [Westerdykella ornata]KAF2271334.1 Bud-site selection protein [Westerdykella ornata]
MPKRKRPSPSPSLSAEESSSNRAVSRQKKLCTQLLTTSQKSLVSALRLGAGFERQKYSRRRKTANVKKDEKAVARLDAEYAVLKGLEIPKIAEQHLRKTILKVKSLREHEGLPESVKEVEGGQKDPLFLNVTARLYKIQAVKKVIDECIEGLKKILKVGGGAQSGGDKGKEEKEDRRKKVKVEDEGDEEGASEDDGEAFAKFDVRIAAPSSGEDNSDDSLSDGQRPPSVAESETGDVELDDITENESSGDEASTQRNSAKTYASEDGSSDDDDDSDGAIPRNGYPNSDENEDSESLGVSYDDTKPAPKAKAKKAAGKPSTSTFLPSLSHAAYYSGSESEASDLDIDIAPKKNRRGQRARQKIWEKKYGEKAKHKQKEERNKGWDPKRGAVSEDRRGRGGREGRGSAKDSMRTGRGPQRSGENLRELGPRRVAKRDDTGPLHPSWQAAKAAKEKELMAKPQGTKIVFD